MEFAQLERRITFLDSQYRRERADLAQLRQRIDLREGEREEVMKRIESLEAELTSMKSEKQRMDLLENKIERLKTELVTSVDNQQKKHRQTLKDVERAHAVEVETQARAINDVRREIGRGQNLDELITLARTETERQSSILTAFQDRLEMLAKQNDEQLRSISYLEEQRRSDVKRLGELQNEITDLFKRLNLQTSKIDLLEDQIPQFSQFQIALERTRETIQAEIERSQHQLAQIDPQIRSWEKLSEQVLSRLDEYEARLKRYAEHYQLNQKSLEGLEIFQERLSREQKEFMELQRLAFDRQQQRLETFEETQEKALRDQKLDVDEKLSEIMKEIKHFQSSIVDVTPQIETLQNQFNLLLRIFEEDTIARTIAAKEWQAQFEQLATEDTE